MTAKEKIELEMQQLAIKKLFKINENGQKIKVRRDNDDEYSIYRNGHFVTTDETWEQASALVLTILNS